MKRIVPNRDYRGLPCSMVALACALGDGAPESARLDALCSSELRSDGYLSLDGFNRLIRANTRVIRRVNFKRDERPTLRDWAHKNRGKRAAVCVYGHYIYYDGRDYYSFLFNGDDPVVSVWYLD